MRKITMDEMKSIELEMLKDVAAFCDKNHIRYYLCGGTLLGAVRHKGFIPWDDDIDIIMPRPDYLKFVSTYNGATERYYVKSIENDPQYWRTFAKVFDARTFLKEDAISVEKPGNAVFIDIFPSDGLPPSRWKQRILFKEQEFLNFLYHGSAWTYTRSHKYNDSKSQFAKAKGIIRTILKFVAVTVLHPLPTRKLIRIINANASKYPFDESEEVAAIVDCAYGGARERISRAKYAPRIEFDFEGCKFWGPAGYEEYLTHLYGNYMEMPPVDRRVTHHDFEAYWKDGEPKV